MDGQTDRHTNGNSDRQTNIVLTNSHTNTQTYRQTDTNMQTDTHTHTHANTDSKFTS
jgi:hypothetical protein